MLDQDYRQIAAYQKLGVASCTFGTDRGTAAETSCRAFPTPATYHDPCYLARGRGITEQPREILRSTDSRSRKRRITAKIRMLRSRRRTTFSSRRLPRPDKGRVNQLRLAQLAETKVSTVVWPAPYCPTCFRDAANHAKRDDIEILDLAEVVAKSIRRKPDDGTRGNRAGAAFAGTK